MVSLEFFIDIKSFRSHYGPGVDSTSDRNEYQEYLLGVKSGRCEGWQPYHHPVPLSCNLVTLTSWNPVGHSRPLTGLLYLYIYSFLLNRVRIDKLPVAQMLEKFSAFFGTQRFVTVLTRDRFADVWTGFCSLPVLSGLSILSRMLRLACVQCPIHSQLNSDFTLWRHNWRKT